MQSLTAATGAVGSAEAPISRPGWKPWLVGAALAAPFLFYLPFCSALWLADDFLYLQGFSLPLPDVLSNIFTCHAWSTSSRDGFFRPLAMLPLAMVCKLDSPFIGHLLNLLVHVLCGLGLYQLLRDHARYRDHALFGYLLFMFNPMMKTSLLWIATLGDLMTGMFSVFAARYYLRGGARRSRLDALLVLAFYACSLLSKEMSLTLPIILLVISWARGTFRADLRLFLGLMAVTALFMLARSWAIGWALMGAGSDRHNFIPGVKTIVSLAKYLYLTVVPTPMYLNYQYPILYLSAAPVLLLVVMYFRKENLRAALRGGSIAAGLFFISLAPVMSMYHGNWRLYYSSVLCAWFIVHCAATVRFRGANLAGYVYCMFLAGIMAIHGRDFIRAGEFSMKLIRAVGSLPVKQVTLADVPTNAFSSVPMFPYSPFLKAGLRYYHLADKEVILLACKTTDVLPDTVELLAVHEDTLRFTLDPARFQHYYDRSEPWEHCSVRLSGKTRLCGPKTATIACPQAQEFYVIQSTSAGH